MSLTSTDSKIQSLLNNRSFIVPKNQRKYVWKKSNWEELIEDMDLVYKQIRPNHFIGSVVLKTEKRNDGIRSHFSIIDGQQRVLTLTILFVAMGYLYVEYGHYNKLRGLEIYLLVTDRDGDKHPIVSEEANKDVFRLVECLIEKANISEKNDESIISADEFIKEAKVSKVISDCFLYFTHEMRERTRDRIEDIDRYQDIIESIRYIDVNADTDEDAYTIFEVLNARGQALTDFDLLRNFLLKRVNQEDKDAMVNIIREIEELLPNNVEEFLKHYALHKYGIRTDKKEKRSYKVISSQEKSSDIKIFSKELLLKAEYYNRILTGKGCSENVARLFAFYKSHNQRQYRPLLLGLIHQKEQGRITDEEYEKINDYLYKFFVCYKIIGEQASNKLDDIVEKYAKTIENDYSEQVLSELRKSLIKRLPNKNNFNNSFKSLCYSNKWKAYSGSQKKAKVFTVLCFLEEIMGCTVTIDKDTYNIEHCLPDSVSEDNIIIGNMMLLEVDINDRVKNWDLEKKSNEYRKSNLTEPTRVADLIDTGKFNLADREKWMAERIYCAIQELSK